MAFTLNVHEMKSVGMSRVVIGASKPYVRIKAGGNESPPVYLQEGKIYYEDGTEVKDLPEWFEDEFKKVSPAMLKNVGMIKEMVKRGLVEDDKQTNSDVPIWNTANDGQCKVIIEDEVIAKDEVITKDVVEEKRGRGRPKSMGGD